MLQATTEHEQVIAAAKSTFKQQISINLDETNYLQWKQQVEGVLRGKKMMIYILSPQIPEPVLTVVHRDSASKNHAYTTWEEQDSLPCT